MTTTTERDGCVCGHLRGLHAGDGPCLYWNYMPMDGHPVPCDCTAFELAPEDDSPETTEQLIASGAYQAFLRF